MVEPIFPSIDPPLPAWAVAGGGAWFAARYEYDVSETNKREKRSQSMRSLKTSRIKKQRHSTFLRRWSAGSRTRSCTWCRSPCKTILGKHKYTHLNNNLVFCSITYGEVLSAHNLHKLIYEKIYLLNNYAWEKTLQIHCYFATQGNCNSNKI